jgi:glycine oxidase
VTWARGYLTTLAGQRGVLSDGATIEADIWAICTGAARGLEAVAPELAALTPIKGHILRLIDGPARGPVVRMARGYICPGEGGAVVGASMEAGRRDLEVDPAVVAGLLDQARTAFPDLSDNGVTVLTGVRAATADGLPLAGASAKPGVWIAGGARRNGWLLAPLIAQGLTAAIAGDRGGLPAAFDPRRFS